MGRFGLGHVDDGLADVLALLHVSERDDDVGAIERVDLLDGLDGALSVHLHTLSKRPIMTII